MMDTPLAHTTKLQKNMKKNVITQNQILMKESVFWFFVFGISSFKLMFVYAYRSTDFEVHRNWLAITYSLPPSQWYFDTTSEWTLDYPPLFAWFERCLATIAYYFDAEMLDFKNLNYASHRTIVFQRLSVIAVDLFFAYCVRSCCLSKKITNQKATFLLFTLLLGNAGLLIVDHIHFQYNGFLFGFLLMSISNIYKGHILQSAMWFSILLNMKHIFFYISPVYFVFMLKHYCLEPCSFHSIAKLFATTLRLVKLGLVVLLVFVITYGPFIDHIGQVISRLFPFKRGLCHAYWAPNFWALYSGADKVATIIGRSLSLNVSTSRGGMTGGLVQEYEHIMLPTITPRITFCLTVLSILPCLWKLWKLPPHPTVFIRSLVLCAYGSFIFGWHVHEKAILMIIIPLTLLTITSRQDAKVFYFVSTVGHFSLHPLLFEPFEMPIKALLIVIYFLYTKYVLENYYSKHSISSITKMYLAGLVPLFVVSICGLGKSYPFLPLLLTSVYCSIGIILSWMYYYACFLQCTPLAFCRIKSVSKEKEKQL